MADDARSVDQFVDATEHFSEDESGDMDYEPVEEGDDDDDEEATFRQYIEHLLEGHEEQDADDDDDEFEDADDGGFSIEVEVENQGDDQNTPLAGARTITLADGKFES